MRDQTEDSWETQPPSVSILRGFLVPNFAAAVEHIQKHADAARQRADEAIQTLQPDEVDLDLLLNTSERIKKQLVEHDLDSTARSYESNCQTLPWLCMQLNQQCREEGRGIVFPLDPCHVSGNYVIVNYAWNERDMEQYDAGSGKLPYASYSRQLCHSDVTCLALLLQDHSVRSGDISASHRAQSRFFPLVVRREHLVKPVQPEPGTVPRFVIIGSTVDKLLLQTPEKRSSWYLLLPSEFTTLYDCGQFRTQPATALKAKGAHMFLGIPADDKYISTLLPDRGAASFDTQSLARNVDIMRYVLNLQDCTIIKQLYKMLRTSGMTSISNPQSKTANQDFDTSAYHTTLARIHQMSWDFGHRRQMHRKDHGQERKRAALDGNTESTESQGEREAHSQ